MSTVSDSNFHVRLNVSAREDLSWWQECLIFFNGRCSFSCDVSLPSLCFSSDACLTGGGAHLAHDWFYCNWLVDHPVSSQSHINTLELLTVLLAI